MRPTDLKFRSPKEKTAEYHDPLVTVIGNHLSLSPARRKPNFSKDERFAQYEVHAKVTGYRVGPGSYDVKPELTKKGPKYRRQSKDMSNNGYFFIGDQIVFDAAFVPKSKKSKLSDVAPRVDASQVLADRPLRPSTAIEKGDKTPWFFRKSIDFTMSDQTRSKTPSDRQRNKPEFPMSPYIRSPHIASSSHRRPSSSFEK